MMRQMLGTVVVLLSRETTVIINRYYSKPAALQQNSVPSSSSTRKRPKTLRYRRDSVSRSNLALQHSKVHSTLEK